MAGHTFNGAFICLYLRSPGIDSDESIPPAYVTWRVSSMTNRVVVPARQAGNRFLSSLKCLQIRAQDTSRHREIKILRRLRTLQSYE